MPIIKALWVSRLSQLVSIAQWICLRNPASLSPIAYSLYFCLNFRCNYNIQDVKFYDCPQTSVKLLKEIQESKVNLETQGVNEDTNCGCDLHLRMYFLPFTRNVTSEHLLLGRVYYEIYRLFVILVQIFESCHGLPTTCSNFGCGFAKLSI